MLNELRKLNSEIKLYTTDDKEFCKYGRVINIDNDNIVDYFSSKKEQNEIKNSVKSNYITHIPNLPFDPNIEKIKHDIFGELPIQVGIVKGRNQSLTGTEYHQGSEVNIAITDCILVLGSKYDMINETIDISQMEIFYIKKGQTIEIYSSTLHYTPIETNTNGFSMLVILLEGTNTDIEFKNGEMLCKKNKWYVCHPSQTEKIKLGFKVGLTGDLLTLFYPEQSI